MVNRHHTHARATGQSFFCTFVQISQHLVHIRKTNRAPLKCSRKVATPERLHIAENGRNFLIGQVVVRNIPRRHWCKANLVKTKIVEEMIPDGLDIGNPPSQGHPGPNRPRRITIQQQFNFTNHGAVCALTTDSNPIPVMKRFRAIHTDSDTDVMLMEIINNLLIEQRCICRQRKIDLLSKAGELWLCPCNNLFNQLKVGQGFTAEEDDVVPVLVWRLPQQHLNRILRGLKAHPFAVSRFIQVFLVTIRTTQVTTRIDVKHHGIKREIFQIKRLPRFIGITAITDKLQCMQFSQC